MSKKITAHSAAKQFSQAMGITRRPTGKRFINSEIPFPFRDKKKSKMVYRVQTVLKGYDPNIPGSDQNHELVLKTLRDLGAVFTKDHEEPDGSMIWSVFELGKTEITVWAPNLSPELVDLESFDPGHPDISISVSFAQKT